MALEFGTYAVLLEGVGIGVAVKPRCMQELLLWLLFARPAVARSHTESGEYRQAMTAHHVQSKLTSAPLSKLTSEPTRSFHLRFARLARRFEHGSSRE